MIMLDLVCKFEKSPYFKATERWGATSYSVYNHMYIPRSFGDPEENFWNLVNAATLSDVSVQRQVEIKGRMQQSSSSY